MVLMPHPASMAPANTKQMARAAGRPHDCVEANMMTASPGTATNRSGSDVLGAPVRSKSFPHVKDLAGIAFHADASHRGSKPRGKCLDRTGFAEAKCCENGTNAKFI